MNFTSNAMAAEPTAIDMAAGEARTLGDTRTGYVIQSGGLEIYARLAEAGEPSSGRCFLFELKAGDLIPPPMTAVEDVTFVAVAGRPCVVAPVGWGSLSEAQAAEGKTALAGQLDRWLLALGAALGSLAGPPPAAARAESVGAVVDVAEGASITPRGAAAWCASRDAELVTAAGEPVASFDGRQLTPLAPGLWLTARKAGAIGVSPTSAALEDPRWPEALAAFHAGALAMARTALLRREADLRDVARTRGEGAARGLERTLGRFEGVLDHAPAWTGAAAPNERILAPFAMICEIVGIDLTQRARDEIRRAGTIEEAARVAKARTRQIALRGDWRREDFGPFIGFLDEERRPVAITPAGSGRWAMVDPDRGTRRPVTRAIAARLQPRGYMLYRALPARPVTLRDVITLGWRENRRDFQIAALASVGVGALGLATPAAMQLAFDRFIPAHEKLQLGQLAIGLILAAIVAAGFRLAYDMAFLRVDGRMAAQVQAAMVDRVLRLPAAALRFSSADLAQRAIAVDGARRAVVGFALGSLPALFSWVCNIALMGYYAPIATVVAAGAFLALLGLSCLAATLQLEAIRRGEEILSDINSLVFHLIRGVGVLRASGAEARAFARWGHDFAEMRARAYRSQRISSLFETFLAGFDVLTMAAVFAVLGTLPLEKFSTGAFMSFITAYGVFVAASIQIARGAAAAIGAKPAWDRAAPLLKTIPEGGATKRDPGMLSGAVEMTNVAFRYSADTPVVLSGFSFKAAAGEFVALVGASGSGKSTFARLLLGSLAPLAGTIQFDSMDLQHLDIQLVRRQIGVVLQGGKLMPGSIYENIMGSRQGGLDEAWEAARQAGIEAEIRALPMTIHTILTDATAAFSGGQLQRILLARALVGKPRILLLDEATSALDNTTQAVVSEALSRLTATRIVVAHRLSTVKSADRICVLDGGRVAQSGKYEELLKARGPFAELARRQLI